MTGLADRSLAGLLDIVAAPDPAPGGGSSSAFAGALAAALLEMSASIELARERSPEEVGAELPARAAELRRELLELADRDLSSYAPVLDARRLPAGHPERADRLDAALTEASQTPLAIAEAGAEAAVLGARVTAASSPAIRGDALTGVLLAEAATVAAAALVEINLTGRDDADLARARDARRRAQEAREDALATLPRA
jgi:formiminotetrahydrofolate cyclodeaminase